MPRRTQVDRHLENMHDSHCHVDAYRYPEEVATAAEEAQIFTVAVTNLPSAYFQGEPHLRGFEFVKLAVGLHPLLVEHHTPSEKELFVEALRRTEFIGEVGLDFSKVGRATRTEQLTSFEFVLEHLQRRSNVVSLHSRGAESEVRRILFEHSVSPVVFHWYSGGLGELERVLRDGHYCSINPQMTLSKSGLRIIERIPTDRILLETDGPFCKFEGRPAIPSDTAAVCSKLGELWSMSSADVTAVVDANFNRLRIAGKAAK